MDYLKAYENFSLFDIFDSEEDSMVKQLLTRIKQYYKIKNLVKNDDESYTYILGRNEEVSTKGIKMTSKINEFKIDDVIVDCSWFLKRRVFKFLQKKFKRPMAPY